MTATTITPAQVRILAYLADNRDETVDHIARAVFPGKRAHGHTARILATLESAGLTEHHRELSPQFQISHPMWSITDLGRAALKAVPK